MYAKSDIELIRSKIDILKFLEDRGITFRQVGTAYVGLCPVHNERSPSFNVKPQNNTFHCFGCGISGDIFSLVQELDSLSFTGAIQELAEYANIEIVAGEEDEAYKAKQRLYQICDIASTWFRQNFLQLDESHLAKKNLSDRNLLSVPNNSLFQYSAMTDKTIGFAPNKGLLDLLIKARFSLSEVVEAGLAKTSETTNQTRDAFRNRLVWTISDVQGRPIGFSARKLFDEDMGPKYLNSIATPLYNKSKTLLGLAAAKKEIVKKQEVYIVEGQTDVMALRSVGIDNVVASCGTAFGADHSAMLLHLSSIGKESEKFRMVFCFDGDTAGIKAAKKVFEGNKSIQLNAFVVKLDGEQGDPCDLRLHQGNDALLAALHGNQTSIVEFILKEELKEWVVTTPEGQSGYLKKAKEILSLINDPIQYASYLRKVSFWTGISYDQINTLVKMSMNKTPGDASAEAVAAAQKFDSMEVRFLSAYLQYPDEMTALIEENKIGSAYFLEHKELAGEVSKQIRSNEIDYNNPEISKLLHIDLKVVEERKADILKNLVKAFFQEGYSKELGRLNAKINEAQEEGTVATDEALLEEIMSEQLKLKQKYNK